VTKHGTVILIVVCVLSCAWGMGAEYYVATDGKDSNPGTDAEPFRSIQHAADVMRAGDTCHVRAGVYREGVRVTHSGIEGKPVRFAAAAGERVVSKGTEPIPGKWEVHKGKIYRTQADLDFIQVFVDDRMMVEARWPNMRFPDELWDRTTWARAGKGSRYGKMVDPALAETGVDWTGGYAILNVAHQFFTWSRTVDKHTAGSATFEYAKDLQGITHYADKTRPWEDDFYYLAGKLDALDAPGEWFLDTETRTLYLWPPDSDDPAAHQVEVKTRNYAFEVDEGSYVELSGFRFLGATFEFRNCRHCVAEDCRLLFPTYARRIADPAAKEPWAERTLVEGSHNTVRGCTFAYSPTCGLVMAGAHNVAEDNLIHDMSWYGCLRHKPLAMSAGPHESSPPQQDRSGFLGVIRHNTVHSVGNAGICFYNGAFLAEYNHVYDGGLCCEDVALIYTHLPICAGSEVRYNWVHGCRTGTGRGLGIRGDDQTRGLIVHHNVVWDCGMCGLIVKGDNNKVYNNTVLDIGTEEKPGCAISMHTKAEPRKPWREQWPLLEQQNANSEIFNNAARTITSNNQGAPFPPGDNLAGNFQGEDFLLTDPAALDFRPKAGSPLIDAGREIAGFTDGSAGDAPDIGAYEYGGENWRPGITWTPETQ